MSGTMEAREILELVDLTLLDRSASEEETSNSPKCSAMTTQQTG